MNNSENKTDSFLTQEAKDVIQELLEINSGGGGGGTSDYDDLTNKPSINGVSLSGDMSADDLGLAETSDIPDVSGLYTKPNDGIPKSDLASDVKTSLGKADTALQSFTETDPTVPSWAKAVNKPTYTASEVGALPVGTAIPSVDNTLTTQGAAADAKATGDAIDEATNAINNINSEISEMVKSVNSVSPDANGNVDVAVDQTLVDNWLDEHPEATTTVQDGSITYSKLNSEVSGDISGLKNALNQKIDIPFTYNAVSTTDVYGYFRNGSVTGATGWRNVCFELSEGDEYKFNASGNGYVYAYYLCDSNDNVISHSSESSQHAYTDETLTVPSGVTRIYLNRQTGSEGVSSFNVRKKVYSQVDLLAMDNSINEIEDTLETLKDYVEIEITNNAGYILSNNTVGGDTFAIYKHSQYIPVEGVEKVKVSCYGNGYSQPYYWFAGTTGNAVGDYATDSGQTISSDTAVTDYVAYVPANAKYLVCNSIKANSYPIKVKLYIATNYKDRIENIESEINTIEKPYSGKKIIFFGTSIMAAGAWLNNRETTIPVYVGDMTGATIINKAISSSMARRGFKSNETANDSYGWTNTPWQNVFLAMGASLIEKQDLIDNYDTKWKDLIGGDFGPSADDGTGTGKPSSLTQEWINQINAASYESILTPYLDGTYDMPDVFIFEHGHNDYKSGDQSATEQVQTAEDMSTYGGVMAYYIRKIFEANPQAKIVIVSHYANDTTKSGTIFDAQKAVADYQHVYFCNVAEGIGWTQRQVTTTGYWGSDGMWVDSGGESQTITRVAQSLKDGLHPSSDKSGKAMYREASIIADFLLEHKQFLIGT